MRLHRIVGMACLGVLWVLGAGCEQEAPPQKPAAPVVKKKIEKPAPQKSGEEGKVAPAKGAAPGPEAKTPSPGEAQPTPGKTPAEGPQKSEIAAVAAPTSATPQPAPKAEYQYKAADRPDPFRPFFEEAKAKGPVAECRDVPPGPLTENEANQFTLVAIVGQGAEAMAMVQDRSGKGYMIRHGNHMGKKCGRVTSIGGDGVTIDEPYEDLLGQKKTRKVTLGFKKSEGGKR